MSDSILQVNQIKDKGGNATGITVADTTANVTINNLAAGSIGSAVTGFTGIKNADQWRLSADYTGGTGWVTSNWERVDNSDYGSIGSAMTQTAGIFTFPDTGIWSVSCTGQFTSASGGIQYAGLHIYTSENAGSGDSYNIRTQTYSNMDSSAYYQEQSSSFLFDCSNVATHKVKFYVEAINSNASLMGHTNLNRTFLTFFRLGDT